VARFTLSEFTTVAVLVFTTPGANLKGFFDGLIDAICGLFMPHYDGVYQWELPRFTLSDLTIMAVLALTTTGAELDGSFCRLSGATYGYLVPFYNGAYHRKELRVHAQRVYDSGCVRYRHDGRLKVFSGGFSDATYGYLVPYVGGANSGKMPRFMPSDFTTLSDFSTMAVLALTTTDAEPGGSFCRISGATYGHLVPLCNGAFHEEGAAVSRSANLRRWLARAQRGRSKFWEVAATNA
jgi:hypothetical protein